MQKWNIIFILFIAQGVGPFLRPPNCTAMLLQQPRHLSTVTIIITILFVTYDPYFYRLKKSRQVINKGGGGGGGEGGGHTARTVLLSGFHSHRSHYTHTVMNGESVGEEAVPLLQF